MSMKINIKKLKADAVIPKRGSKQQDMIYMRTHKIQ